MLILRFCLAGNGVSFKRAIVEKGQGCVLQHGDATAKLVKILENQQNVVLS